ncbi:hypothetical protein [Paenibacillus validus]
MPSKWSKPTKSSAFFHAPDKLPQYSGRRQYDAVGGGQSLP